jgi:predicted HicB family RNase H-like nuclease
MAKAKKAAAKKATTSGREQVVLRFRKGLKNAVIKAAGDVSLNSFIESKLAKSVGFSLA